GMGPEEDPWRPGGEQRLACWRRCEAAAVGRAHPRRVRAKPQAEGRNEGRVGGLAHALRLCGQLRWGVGRRAAAVDGDQILTGGDRAHGVEAIRDREAWLEVRPRDLHRGERGALVQRVVAEVVAALSKAVE